MKSSDLHSLWSAPDNSKLTNKQYSFRLPVHVAAKIAALCDIYPQKTRTEIVGDLLSTAIDDLVKGMPSIEGRELDTDPDTGETIYEEIGPSAQFWKLADKHYKALEQEMGNANPSSLRESMYSSKRADTEG